MYVAQLLKIFSVLLPASFINEALEDGDASANKSITETIPKFMILGGKSATIEYLYPTKPELNYQVERVPSIVHDFFKTAGIHMLALKLGNEVVLHGSRDNEDIFEGSTATKIYEPRTNEWSEGPNSTFTHLQGAGAVVHSTLVLCGGSIQNYSEIHGYAHANCESLTIGDKEWKPVAPMITPRYSHLAVALKGRIFMIAGRGRKVEPSIESFDLETGQWSEDGYMHDNTDTSNGDAAVLDGYIYLCAGNSLMRYDPFGEKLDLPPYNKWEVLAKAPKSRFRASLVVFDGSLLLIGGQFFGEFTKTNTISSYNPEMNEWTDLNQTMITPREQMNVVVLNEIRDEETVKWTRKEVNEWEEELRELEKERQRIAEIIARLRGPQ